MANRRFMSICSRFSPLLLESNEIFKCKTLPLSSCFSSLAPPPVYPFSDPHIFMSQSVIYQRLLFIRNLSSRTRYSSGEEEEDDDDEREEDDDDDELEEEEEGEELSTVASSNVVNASNCIVERATSTPEEEEEASAIGYRVIGPLDPSDRPFKQWEPVFAVVQIGSHQFKVSNGDSIYTERLKHCEVNDKLILNRVLMLGSKSQTMIGRPVLPDASVHAVVEEHALDAKVIVFKKKRRKNYRRTKGHRQELTRLRITDIQGIEKPQKASVVV